MRVSTSRLPADHFISGALFGGMTAAAFGIYNKEKATAENIKEICKYAVEGGIATSLSISASNKLVSKNYLGAAFDVALGVGMIVAIENILKVKEEQK
ncbi:hypothetical protein CBLAS_1363 [Campylobacter blaseri]|uniref:Cys/Met metabolism pyridoxal-phosphate-dependent enzyme n=1 Tax=Campylobacter blaseri TaxID=2042961 RepID=A0A2P8QYY9_9BACT|nr:hypothetical protein [Campylobacter blaseri]PSM51465.1 hypothetical protein CQ405_07810 [Campylobacter blaseri]PSM52914.1 hypothetical protein CRN67_07815 [Campylobacter blaseri]QKF86530.1 hypothetical protein CBLAS_1363 [Campylobacter blaseri]